jgi:AcrR family transcriptional regulator
MENLSRRDKEKLAREKDIISAAEKIFSEKGFDGTSMDEIAKEAEFTKRTVYQYFKSKEDLFFAVVLRCLKKLISHISRLNETHLNGYMKMQKGCKKFYEFYKTNPETFRIISYWGHVKKKLEEQDGKQKELLDFNKAMFESIAQIIEEGKKDGSINLDIDSQKTAFSLIFLMTSFFNQLSVTGESFTKSFSMDIEGFSFFTIEFVLKSLKRNDG